MKNLVKRDGGRDRDQERLQKVNTDVVESDICVYNFEEMKFKVTDTNTKQTMINPRAQICEIVLVERM